MEESQLLDSVERFGFGNWEDIKTMLSGRTVEEVKAHYGHFYIDGNIGIDAKNTRVFLNIVI